ncbi:MAG: D-aminoacyl-tRNA deacylase [Treponema sp.]|nr:D-aminoacyl-tRNA deacylase [Treponema sp.]
MKAVVQRVLDASVRAGGTLYGQVDRGLLVYLGVAAGDTERDAGKLAEKIAYLRIFNDDQGKMNLSIKDISREAGETALAGIPVPGEIPAPVGVLVVSQFTLLADTRKGRRPFYGGAAESGAARVLYECFTRKLGERGLDCRTGVFQAHMELRYTNDGPVTIILDSQEL